MDLVLGVDGGGTKTRLALARLDGEVIAESESGSAHPHDVGWQGTRMALHHARERAFAAAGRAPVPVRAAVAGLAGVALPGERATLLALLGDLGLAPEPTLRALPDLEIAWKGALGGAPGIVLVAGTGSVAYGRDEAGRSARAGGWGPRIDDAGSATWIAREALAAAARGEDGRDEPTSLGATLCQLLHCADFAALRARLAAHELPRDDLAALAMYVDGAARAGDAAASRILERAGAELAALARAVARALGVARPVIACTGAVLAPDTIVREALVRALARELPEHQLLEPMLPPVGGALLYALELAGVGPDPSVLERLASTLAAT